MNAHVETFPGVTGQSEQTLGLNGQPAIDPTTETSGAGSRKAESNGQAAAILGQLRSELADIRRALGGVGDGPARLRLLDAAAQVQGAMSQVYEAVNSGNGNNITIAMPDVSGAVASVGDSDGNAAGTATAAEMSYRVAFDAMRDNTRKVIHELFDDRSWTNDLNIADPKKKNDLIQGIDEIGARAKANEAAGTDEGNVRSAADAQAMVHTVNAHKRHLTQADIDREHRTDAVLDEARRRAVANGRGEQVEQWITGERQEVYSILEKKGIQKEDIDKEFTKHQYNPAAVMTDLLDRNDADLKKYYQDVNLDYKSVLNLDMSSLKQDGHFLGMAYKFTDDPSSKTELLWARDNTTGRQTGTDAIPASGQDLPQRTQEDIDHKADVLLALAKQRAVAEGHGDAVQQWLTDESQEVGKLLQSKGLAKDAVDSELAKHKDNPIAVARSMLDPASLSSYYDDVRKDVASILNLTVDPVMKDGKVTEVTYKFTDSPTSKTETMWALNSPSDQPALIQTVLASNNQDDIGATLRSAGMKLTGGSDITNPTHGLTIEKPANALSGQGVVVA